MGNPRSPLGFVDSLVAGKQFLLPLRAEPVEAGGKVVMDEHVLRAGDAHAGGLDAAAIVVVLEEPDAERLVQRPDPLVGGSRHGHAEAADRRDVAEDAGMLARMPRPGLLHLPHGRILALDARLVPDVVGPWHEGAQAGGAPEG